MTTSLNPFDPDIESVARAFAERAAAAPDEALSRWRADTVSLSPVQRATGARLAASQLNWQAKAALGGSSSGSALLADWESDRLRAPYVPQLPLLTTRQTYAYCAGIVLFAVLPGLAAESVWRSVLLGAALGLLAYGTYDMTNLATLRDWPVLMTIVDIAWGTLLTGTVAGLSHLAVRQFV